MSSICDPLNTYIRHGCAADALRDSGGSWYLSIIVVPEADLTALDSAARRPVGAKFGFCFSGSGVFEAIVVSVEANTSLWEGRGPAARFRGRGEILCGAFRGRGERDGE